MEVMFQHSYETVKWMRDRGVKWQLTLGKFFDENAIAKGGMFDLSPGGCLMAQNEGEGLTDDFRAAVEACRGHSIDVFYSSSACELLADDDTVTGVRTRQRDGFVDFKGQVILACGGFEASARLRRQYLGEGWDMVVVRGTRSTRARCSRKRSQPDRECRALGRVSCESAGPRRTTGWGSKC
jgi:tricarballylate dehydrogenase